jgi:hypothetical protein
MKHITKKRVSRGRKRGQVRTQARPRKRASVTRHRKKNKSRRGLYTKKRKVMAGGVKPEGWDNMTFPEQISRVYDERFWKDLDDETKIEFINKIPNDNSLSIRLDSLSYTSNSQAVKDAIATRTSSAGPAVAPKGSHRLSPTSSPGLPLPDFSTVALNANRTNRANSADLSRPPPPSSYAKSPIGSFREHPFQPHPFQRSAIPPSSFLDPQGSSQPVDPVVVSSSTSQRPYLEPPETSSSSLQQPDTLTMRYQPPSTSPPGSIHSLASHEPVSARTQEPVLSSESRATQQQLPPSRPPPPPPSSSSSTSSSPSESIPPPPPSQLPPTNQEPVLPPPNLLDNLPPVQNEKNTHDVPIQSELFEEITNKSGNNNSRTVICDCTRSSTPPTPPTPPTPTPPPKPSHFSRAKAMANNWVESRVKSRNKA